MSISDSEFEEMLTRALSELPEKYIQNLDNVAITYAEFPSDEQLHKQGVRENQLLLGLYEGIPLTQRGAGYNLVLPDKITIFKRPIVQLSDDHEDLFRRVKHTLWHEIAHHYGLNHNRIDELENKH
ncbi:metallopeptidase family protein [Candidatus Saccharibacteria bacterium]|nr:metallopeptidase family protein [Candidatus Saccharibacteria bacterium]